MATNQIGLSSHYAGKCIVLPTKHAKGIAIAPAFERKLKAGVLEYVIDTDLLGTFSGEVERDGNALECARKKCELSLQQLGEDVQLVIASEGSFGPHPLIPFSAYDHEILYFIDRELDFHLHVSTISTHTNYRMSAIDSIGKLQEFAKDTLFPSHALILRPNGRLYNEIIFKGITNEKDLLYLFEECKKHALNGTVWVQTDMRAQFNPSRMEVIQELAVTMTERLAVECYKCGTPGWGKIKHEEGLECSWCGLATNLVKRDIYGCAKCDHVEFVERADGLKHADPEQCQYCNP